MDDIWVVRFDFALEYDELMEKSLNYHQHSTQNMVGNPNLNMAITVPSGASWDC